MRVEYPNNVRLVGIHAAKSATRSEPQEVTVDFNTLKYIHKDIHSANTPKHLKTLMDASEIKDVEIVEFGSNTTAQAFGLFFYHSFNKWCVFFTYTKLECEDKWSKKTAQTVLSSVSSRTCVRPLDLAILVNKTYSLLQRIRLKSFCFQTLNALTAQFFVGVRSEMKFLLMAFFENRCVWKITKIVHIPNALKKKFEVKFQLTSTSHCKTGLSHSLKSSTTNLIWRRKKKDCRKSVRYRYDGTKVLRCLLFAAVPQLSST